MEVKEYLDIAELEGQIVEGTWCGYVLTLKNGKAYKLKDGIRGWSSGMFHVKNGELEDIPGWNVSQLFEDHLEDVLQMVLEKCGPVDANENEHLGEFLIANVKRKWFEKWLNNDRQQ